MQLSEIHEMLRVKEFLVLSLHTIPNATNSTADYENLLTSLVNHLAICIPR